MGSSVMKGLTCLILDSKLCTSDNIIHVDKSSLCICWLKKNKLSAPLIREGMTALERGTKWTEERSLSHTSICKSSCKTNSFFKIRNN